MEENVTMTQKELAEKIQNAFAEGSRKSVKTLFEELGIENKEAIKKYKEDFELSKTEIQKREDALKVKDDEIGKRDIELSVLKAEKIALKYTNQENIENVIALIRGKGQEITEANIKIAAELFPKDTRRQFGQFPKPDGSQETEYEKWLKTRPYLK
jgi:3-methyladenine DNA glycosylase AlkD